MFGFLNVYKPKGKTSHDVVAILRRVTQIKQIGHTGTLDPFAEGVLPVCIGKATKLIEYLKDDKAYKGTVQLGESTTTYDTEGEVVKTSSKEVSEGEIEIVLRKFRGEISQTPPIYSAIKVNGKKLYEYARKGLEVEIKPRMVTISKLELLNFNPETNELEIYVECSKGTYIRSLANDIGDALGTYGHLNKLVRVKAGDFSIENSTRLEALSLKSDVENYLVNPLDYLDYPVYELKDDEYIRVSNGNSIETELKGTVLITCKGSLAAIGQADKGLLKPVRVFI